MKQGDWDDLLDLAFDAAFAPASAEILNGLYTPKRFLAIVNKSRIIEVAKAFSDLTYTN